MDEVILSRIRQEAYEQGYQDGKVDGYNLAGTQMSSAKQERKKGKWLDNETSYSDDIPQTCTCSVCGIRSRRPVGDFCKWCGADMREDTDNQITVCPMCPDCPDNCPLGADMRKEKEDATD